MKLLYTFITLGFLQLLALKPLLALNTTNDIKFAENKIIEFYNNGMSLLAKDFCAKAKLLSEQILKDVKVQKASTPQMLEFKRNITSFLHNYPFYQHYGLFNKLLRIFSDMTIGYYYQDNNNKQTDTEYILKLLKDKGHTTISDEYENKFVEFVKEKFLFKYEEFMKQLTKQDLAKRQGLEQFYKDIKKCQDYACYYKNFNILINLIETPKEELISLINMNLERIIIFYITTANDVTRSLIKDEKLNQLKPSLKEQLLKDVMDFHQKYDNNNKFDLVYDLILYFHTNISLKYYYNERLPTKDLELLRNLFDQHGFMKLQSYNQMIFNDFVQRGLPKLFEKFKKYLTKEELDKEKELLKWYEDLQKLQTYEERVTAFYKFITLTLTKKI